MFAHRTYQESARNLEALFKGAASCFAAQIPETAQALLAWGVATTRSAPVVVICDGPQSLENMHQNIATLRPGHGAGTPPVLYYPTQETGSGGTDDRTDDPEWTGHRFSTLLTLHQRKSAQKPGACLVVTCIQALLQKIPPPQHLVGETIDLALKATVDFEAFAGRLVAMGYTMEPEVSVKGSAARKGGLMDVWPPTEPRPLRIEFFGSSIESIRSFDPGTQCSIEKQDTAQIPPAHIRHFTEEADAVLADYLPEDTCFLWSDMDGIRYHAGLQKELASESGQAGTVMALEILETRLAHEPTWHQIFFTTETPENTEVHTLPFIPLDGISQFPPDTFQPDLMEAARLRLFDTLRAKADAGHAVHLFFDTDGSLHHFKEQNAELAAKFHLHTGILSDGFLAESPPLAVVAEADLYGRCKQLGRRYNPRGDAAKAAEETGTRITELTDLYPGDLVVHVDHGVGRYLGLFEIVFNGKRQEVLSIEYAEGAQLHVPVSQIHLLSRYVGVARHQAVLHALGGRRWHKERGDAEKAVVDMASALLETQAKRQSLKGYAFAADTPWQREFEASFPYRETPDQITVINDIKADMEITRPMDRLVCGDAGYGKTEVAIRAAFKAVMSAKQVAILVPTTVLAQQHFQTFTERMAAYPVRIEMLSRLRGAGERANVLNQISEGAVDIVIGTHALLQPRIHFKDLGLVIVDEEQRFGVKHKEKLKLLRTLVDVLTLTATPIPRTLYMSMTGARDMSLLQTPPRERTPIETLVMRYTDKAVREAILRELNREGQVFFLHNRILTIHNVHDQLRKLVPEARIRIGHGRMTPGELSQVMHEFTAGQFDVLLCTTIVESGVDIPRANTIIIDRAERFGIADLYQLRGRVGRSNRKGYAYLLLPASGIVDTEARRRISAVKKHSQLGSGFQLALRDLEIRGSGNLLGAEQSGHISAVGFGLYCQLLQQSVARLKGKPLPTLVDVETKLDFIDLAPATATHDTGAFIPYAYIEDERLRLGIYRKIAEATALRNLTRLQHELTDRYGAIPAAVMRLLKMGELRILAASHRITQIETREEKVFLTDRDGLIMRGSQLPRLRAKTAEAKLDELVALVRSLPEWRRKE